MKRINYHELILILLFCSTVISCNKRFENEIVSGKSDTILLKEPIVLFISPSPKEIEKLKKKYKDDFYTIADDANFYFANATEYLDSLKKKSLNYHKDIIMSYKNGTELTIIPKYKNPWYVVFYKSGTYKIVDLLNFKEEYISFFNDSPNVEKGLQQWYGTYLNTDSKTMLDYDAIINKVGWYKLTVKEGEIHFESDERMESQFPTEAPGGYFINYKCDYKIVGDTLKLYKKDGNDSKVIPQQKIENSNAPDLILYKRGDKYYAISPDISESEDLINSIRSKSKTPYPFLKFDLK